MNETTIQFDDEIEITLRYTYTPGDTYTPDIYHAQPVDEEELAIDSATINGVDVWYSLTTEQKEECLEQCWGHASGEGSYYD